MFFPYFLPYVREGRTIKDLQLPRHQGFAVPESDVDVYWKEVPPIWGILSLSRTNTPQVWPFRPEFNSKVPKNPGVDRI